MLDASAQYHLFDKGAFHCIAMQIGFPWKAIELSDLRLVTDRSAPTEKKNEVRKMKGSEDHFPMARLYYDVRA